MCAGILEPPRGVLRVLRACRMAPYQRPITLTGALHWKYCCGAWNHPNRGSLLRHLIRGYLQETAIVIHFPLLNPPPPLISTQAFL